MLIGTNFIDGSIAHMPNGWADGESSIQLDGTVPFNSPDESGLGGVNLVGLEADTDYVLKFNLDNSNGVEITENALPGGPYVYSHDGAVVQRFTTNSTGCSVNFRGTGSGAGKFGPFYIGKVLAE